METMNHGYGTEALAAEEVCKNDGDLNSVDFLPQAKTTLLNVEELAAILRIGRNSAYRLVNTGQISYLRIGRTIRIPYAAVVRYVESALS